MGETSQVAKELGRRIRDRRLARGWSQEELAASASIHRTYLAGIELGIRNPSLQNIVKIANALGTDLRHLFGDDGNG